MSYLSKEQIDGLRKAHEELGLFLSNPTPDAHPWYVAVCETVDEMVQSLYDEDEGVAPV